MATSRKSQNAKTGQSQSRTRKKPGSGGQGDYYHVEVRDRGDFETFRTQDIGEAGHLQRVAGKRSSWFWATVKWLIGKEDAHVEDGKLVGDTKDANDLIKKLGSQPVHISSDRFKPRIGRMFPSAPSRQALKRGRDERTSRKLKPLRTISR
ncbi:MAG: hypothetical protein ACR2G6_11785 [Gemmatimonadaceae bacterium]